MTPMPERDALFSRKGEAQPAVQAAIGLSRPNRFESLARGLGVTPESEAPTEADTPHHGDGERHTVLRLVHTDQDDAPGPAPRADAGASADGAAQAPGLNRATSDPCPPWIAFSRRRRPKSAAAAPGAQTGGSAPAAPPYHGGLDLAVGAGLLDDVLDDEPTPVAAPQPSSPRDEVRRRRVSVRLPTREHSLLRQFSALCGETLQDIVRRAVLTYMINDLNSRLAKRGRSDTPKQR